MFCKGLYHVSTRLRPKWLTPNSGSSTIVPPFVRSPLGPFGDIFAPPLTAEEEPLGHKRSRQHAPSASGVRGFDYVGFILFWAVLLWVLFRLINQPWCYWSFCRIKDLEDFWGMFRGFAVWDFELVWLFDGGCEPRGRIIDVKGTCTQKAGKHVYLDTQSPFAQDSFLLPKMPDAQTHMYTRIEGSGAS